jgi:hypothetical protein
VVVAAALEEERDAPDARRGRRTRERGRSARDLRREWTDAAIAVIFIAAQPSPRRRP